MRVKVRKHHEKTKVKMTSQTEKQQHQLMTYQKPQGTEDAGMTFKVQINCQHLIPYTAFFFKNEVQTFPDKED